MTGEQAWILGVLAATVAMFLWGKWRHDLVAVGSLLACVALGLVPSTEAFAGFGHPAVITVACVLVLSRALLVSGAIDAITSRFIPSGSGALGSLTALVALGAVLSAFMNNVGALALLMPVAVQLAIRHQVPPGRFLMPLAFGSILGGMTTLIGTPPNLIVSGFREETGEGSFGMFDFTPVGAAVAGAGVLFLVVLGWRLVPVRERAGVEGFDTGKYITEVRVTKESKAPGKTLGEVESILGKEETQVLGLIRNETRITAPHRSRKIRDGDILVIEAEPESLSSALSSLGLDLEEKLREDEEELEEAEKERKNAKPSKKETKEEEAKEPEEVALMEVAIRPDASLVGQSAKSIQLRTRYGINLLALSRQGRRSVKRLRSMSFEPGDVLLLQGTAEAITTFGNEMGCIPLAQRSIRLPNRRQALLAGGVMLAAVAGAAFGLLPAAISFATGVLACLVLKLLPLRSVYEAVDWPVVVLLAALIPVAGAMAVTGAADLIARFLLETVAQANPVWALVLILILTMTLSDFMNNAATAAVMCPIAISAAEYLGVRADPFLMAVAIGGSCAFLTPIGHQNNTLILGPGGFRFGDYWKLGLPMEIVVVAVAIPMLLWIWPL